MVDHVFVYGTLKRGQCRETLWPLAPKMIQPAWVRGALYDLGPYPAMVAGNDRILGELWSFASSDMESVLVTLDKIEGTNQPNETDEYLRIRLNASLVGNQCRESLNAWCYCYARSDLLNVGQRLSISPAEMGTKFVCWPIEVCRQFVGA
ncbi:MAG: gamma-glutamylcyclotransferase [Planctomycetales bacterium]|nr:gamma-glutamylcyclotransferase [Planctomycetales bacterium]